VVKWTILAVEGQPVHEGFLAFQRFWGERSKPPAITVQLVAGLANPDFLVEIEAVAVV
jgi:enamine deaminase RidA (YjgF/YER057c/UK114 family)